MVPSDLETRPRNSWVLRIIKTAACVFCMLLTTSNLVGCICADGRYFYGIRGKLVGGELQSPVPDLKVTVSPRGPAARGYHGLPYSEYTHSDEKGNFKAGLRCGGWGQMWALGFIPLNWQANPVPPPLESVYVYVLRGEEWNWVRVPLTKSQQAAAKPNFRVIDLGCIEVPSRRGGSSTGPATLNAGS